MYFSCPYEHQNFNSLYLSYSNCKLLMKKSNKKVKKCIILIYHKKIFFFELLPAYINLFLTVSLYGSPVLFVRTKSSELQICIDFHALNAIQSWMVFL